MRRAATGPRVSSRRGGDTTYGMTDRTSGTAGDPPPDLAEALAAAARSMGGRRTVDETLGVIADTARRSIPGFDHVGISTIDKGGVITTRAATDDLVNRLDDLQYGLAEGPCVDALRKE